MIRRTLTLAALAVFVGLGGAQRSQPLKPGQLPINDPGDVLTRDEANSRRWTLRAQVRYLGFQPRSRNTTTNITAPTQSIQLDRAQFVYPLIGETSMSVPYPDQARFRLGFDRSQRNNPNRDVVPGGRFPVLENIVDNNYDVIEGYQGPTSLMRLIVEEIDVKSMMLQVELDVRSWETRIDERRADAIEWPEEAWPPQLASALEPQLFVNPEHPSVVALLNAWLNGQDPRSVRPYALAKSLAGQVVEYVAPDENDFNNRGRTPEIGQTQRVLVDGFRVNGSVFAAENGRGSRFDAPALLCALYRSAGLPARLVIGYDVAETQRRERDLGSSLPILRSWVEFALLDERREVTEWIPVDITRQRDFSSRAPPLNQRWQYFGHNEEFDDVVPISHHWHPPTTVVNAGPPGLWGYLPEPDIPEVDTELIFEAFESPIRGNDPVDPYRRP